MKSKAFKMYLKPGMEEEYRRRHDRATDTLFAVQKTRGGTGSQEMTDNALVRRWWDYMADVIVVEADNAPVSEELPELFYME